MNCPVCQSKKTETLLRRINVPAHQNLLYRNKEDAQGVKRGILALVFCMNCDFIFNRAFDEGILSYDIEYNNSQMASPMFQDYVEKLISYLINKHAIKNKSVLEVGCGKGYFLKDLCIKGNNRGIGFDTSYSGSPVILNGRVKFVRRLYACGNRTPFIDAVLCRHVIEHVQYLLNLLGSIKKAVSKSKNGWLFFETPSVEWILEHNVIWDFFYEHCSYFSEKSLRIAVEKSGFSVWKIKRLFAGQYFWLEARFNNKNKMLTEKEKPKTKNILGLVKKFKISERKTVEKYKAVVKNLKKNGNVAIWGAGAKGVTFANLIDPGCNTLSCIIDLSPDKQGHFIPGAGHPVIGPKEIARYGIKSAILMNPNYMHENRRFLDRANLKYVDLVELKG